MKKYTLRAVLHIGLTNISTCLAYLFSKLHKLIFLAMLCMAKQFLHTSDNGSCSNPGYYGALCYLTFSIDHIMLFPYLTSQVKEEKIGEIEKRTSSGATKKKYRVVNGFFHIYERALHQNLPTPLKPDHKNCPHLKSLAFKSLIPSYCTGPHP